MDQFINECGKPILENMVQAIQENKVYLGDIDGLIGDGDHGMNMNKGFTLFGQRIQGQNISFTKGLDELGNVLFSEIGGSMGPIYGTIFMGMADKGEGLEQIGLRDFTQMLDSGLEGLFEIVEARVGDKTLVDTLVPALEALKRADEQGKSFFEALEDMKQAAKAGRDTTKELTAQFGRAARLGERSRGVLDAGAVSCCLILTAMADGIQQLLTERA